MKDCSKCKIKKDESEFYKRPSSRDGLRGSCKTCLAIKNRIAKRRHTLKMKTIRDAQKPVLPEGKKRCTKCDILKDITEFKIVKCRGRQYRDSICGVCFNEGRREYCKKWRNENKDKADGSVKKYQSSSKGKNKRQKYCEEHSDQHARRAKAWRVNNKERSNELGRLKDAKEREQLSDRYIKKILTAGSLVSSSDIPIALIKYKRNLLTLIREAKKLKNENSTTDI